jgi:TnsA endonuclease N terminal
MSYKGTFKPKNPTKYNGNANNIIYRSLWELRVMKYLDDHPEVIWWASEELIIPYYNPIDNKKHRYFPDFVAKMKRKDGTVMTYVIEVKPEIQTKQPEQKRKTKKYIQESMTYIVNQSKWKAATEFCKDHGWEFKIITEKHLGL